MLQYQDAKASQIVAVEDKSTRAYTTTDLEKVSLAEEYEELQDIIDQFGDKNYVTSNSRFSSASLGITNALADNDLEQADDKLSELKRLIERYLPVRSKSAVVEAVYENDKLVISGAIQKTLSFREDLYVDIFDQGGNRVEEIALKDTSSGMFNEVFSKPFEPGMYVVQLEYHDLIVSDFFHVPNF